jgi:hypothetical protein
MAEPHPIRRARQRLGIEVDTETLRRWRRMILDGRAVLVRRETATVAVWRLEDGGVRFRVVYNEAHRVILTVLEGKDSGHPKPRVRTKAEVRRLSIKRHRGY